MSSEQIKQLLKEEGIYMWQVAKALKVHETSFCKWFREDLTSEQVQQVLSAVETIKQAKSKTNQIEGGNNNE